jgi:hypothetical protein
MGLSEDCCQLETQPSGKRKAKKNFTVFVKTPNGREEKATSKGTTGMARFRGSAR